MKYYFGPKLHDTKYNSRIYSLNVAVFMKLLEFPKRHLFTGKGGVYPMEGGVYFEITFFKSLTTVIINRLYKYDII